MRALAWDQRAGLLAISASIMEGPPGRNRIWRTGAGTRARYTPGVILRVRLASPIGELSAFARGDALVALELPQKRWAAAPDLARRFGDAPVHEVVAGVVDPPGPDEVRDLADTVLRGVAGDLSTTLDRAAAFTRICASGRAELPESDAVSAARLVSLADHLESAARAERAGHLA